MLTMEIGMQLSAIVDKLDLKMPKVTKDTTQEALGADLMLQALSKVHRAKNEIYVLVSEIKGCTKEEAKKVNLVEFIRELMAEEGVTDFLSSAVNSQITE